jgi:hypothetical protein
MIPESQVNGTKKHDENSNNWPWIRVAVRCRRSKYCNLSSPKGTSYK